MDSNYNKFSRTGYFLSKNIKYSYPVKYIQAFTYVAHSDTFRLNIDHGGKLKVFIEYPNNSYSGFNFHNYYFIIKNKLKLINR